MIANVVDQRRRPYRWKWVHVIAEATFHDNTVDDSDQAAPAADSVDYAEFDGSLAEAIAWGQGLLGEVTLFIYDGERLTGAQQ